MKYNQLVTYRNKSANRIGRGISAGQGKTAGRGTKGQKARAGSTKKPGFSGGQNPLMQQLPKLPGFKSHRPKAENIFTEQLNKLNSSTINAKTLADAGLITNMHTNVKLLFKGEIKNKMDVSLENASAKAIEAIELSGGTYTKVKRIPRTQKKKER